MKINFNLYKKYQHFKKSRPIRVIAQEVKEGCSDCYGSSDGWDKVIKDVGEISKKVDELTEIFEKAGMPPEVETDFGNGVKLLKRRIAKDKRDSFTLAENADKISIQ